MKKFKKQIINSAFILGSTSQIAKSICIELAINYRCRKFHLLSRNLETNKELCQILNNKYGATVTEEEFDLSNNELIANPTLPKVDFFDLYLITAGSLGAANLARSNIHEALEITLVNYVGLIPWITSIAKEDRLSKPGKLWIFSSVASDLGRPSNYHYGAAKAGLTTFCEGLLLRCTGKPFSVRIIKAGFINTLMTEGKAPKILCASTTSVAKNLLRRPNRRGIEYLPWWWKIIMIVIQLLPRSISSKL